MEESTTAPIEQTPVAEQPQPTLSAFNPIARTIFSVLLVIVGAICAIRTAVLTIATITLIPKFFLHSVNHPYAALLGTFTYAGSTFLAGGLCVLSFIFAHHLIKNQSISRQAVILCIAFLILAAVLEYACLPLFGSTFTA